MSEPEKSEGSEESEGSEKSEESEGAEAPAPRILTPISPNFSSIDEMTSLTPLYGSASSLSGDRCQRGSPTSIDVGQKEPINNELLSGKTVSKAFILQFSQVPVSYHLTVIFFTLMP